MSGRDETRERSHSISCGALWAVLCAVCRFPAQYSEDTDSVGHGGSGPRGGQVVGTDRDGTWTGPDLPNARAPGTSAFELYLRRQVTNYRTFAHCNL